MKKLPMYLFCTFICFCLLSCVSGPAKKEKGGLPTDGLCLYVPFDQLTDGRFVDKSENNYSSDKPEESNFLKEGKINGALTLSGEEEYLTFDADKNQKLGAAGSSYSVSCWINTTVTSEDTIWYKSPIVICKRDPNSKNRPFLFYITMDGTIGLHFEEPQEEIEGTTVISDGQWHHIAMRRNGGKAEIFVDGKKEVEGAIEDNDKTNDGLFVIGARFKNSGDPTGFFAGSIDELRIYTRSLTDEELMDLYKQEK